MAEITKVIEFGDGNTTTIKYDDSHTINVESHYEDTDYLSNIHDYQYTAYEDENLNNFYEGGISESPADLFQSPIAPFSYELNSVTNGVSQTIFSGAVMFTKQDGIVYPVTDFNIQDIWWYPSVYTDQITIDGQTFLKYSINIDLSNSWTDYCPIYFDTDEGVNATDELKAMLINPVFNGAWSTPFGSIYSSKSPWFNDGIQKFDTLRRYSGGKCDAMYLPSLSEDFPIPDENGIQRIILDTGDYIITVTGDKMNYAKVTVTLYMTSEGALLQWLARYGLKFKYNNKFYKPIAEDGYITGVTDDMSKTSDWDNWTNTSGITIPTDRPKHGTDTDGIDDMELNNSAVFSNGMTDYYIMTAGQIETLSNAISTDTTYIGLSDNIVSLMAFMVNPSRFCTGSGVDTVSCGALNVSTGTATKITALTPVFHVGSTKVQGKYGSVSQPHFLDLEPYSHYELYIPMCGTIPLPSRCVYNTIDVYLIGDVITGSCTGIVKCNGEIVAQKQGMIATPIPMTITDSAEQNYKLLQSVINSVGIGAGVVMSGASNNISGMISGTISGISNIAQSCQTANTNYTHQIGSTGSITDVALPKTCYLKRYAPIDKSDDTYTSRYGRPVCENRTLASGDGFTVVDNAVITGNMTQAERTAIVNMMKTGIIL